jgi:hypothetical protein
MAMYLLPLNKLPYAFGLSEPGFSLEKKGHQKGHQSVKQSSEIASFHEKPLMYFRKPNRCLDLLQHYSNYIFTYCGNPPEAAYGDIFAIFQ